MGVIGLIFHFTNTTILAAIKRMNQNLMSHLFLQPSPFLSFRNPIIISPTTMDSSQSPAQIPMLPWDLIQTKGDIPSLWCPCRRPILWYTPVALRAFLILLMTTINRDYKVLNNKVRSRFLWISHYIQHSFFPHNKPSQSTTNNCNQL